MNQAPEAAVGTGGAGMRAIVVSRTPKQKITFIKQIRAISGLGLKEAKDVAEIAAPFVLVVADMDVAEVFVRTAEKQLGESGVFEVYEVEAGLTPAIARPLTAQTVLGPLGSGCAAKAAVVGVGFGVALYLVG